MQKQMKRKGKLPFSALVNPHGKAKRYFSYDKYVVESEDLEVEDDVLELEEFKHENMFVIEAPSSNTKPAWSYPVVGSVDLKRRYTLKTEVGKKVLLSLINGVCENFSEGHCFSTFDASNIVFTCSGRVLFKRVNIIDSSGPAWRRNIVDTCNLMKDIVGMGHIPEDTRHLLDLMEGHTKEELYSIHSSLVPIPNRGWALIQMYDLVKYKMTPAEKDQILLKLPYHDDWRSRVNWNWVLQETYDFSPKSYVPSLADDGTELSPVGKQLQSAERLLDFVRNGTSHRLQRTLIAEAFEYELILLAVFPRLLPLLQEAILDVLGAKGIAQLKAIYRPLLSNC